MMKNRLIHIAKNLRDSNKEKVNGRVACLGRDIFDLTYQTEPKPVLINQQKARIDLLMDWLNGAPKPRSKLIKRHLLRRDVISMIDQQELLPWKPESKIKYFLIDSFSELTDQKFTHKSEGWSFCAHYSDINHSLEFRNEFECHGLLPLNELCNYYNRFFDWVAANYPQKYIFFIHFPTKLDNRHVYKERGDHIFETIAEISKQRPFVKNIYLHDESVFKNESDEYPYHYARETYVSFTEIWKNMLQVEVHENAYTE